MPGCPQDDASGCERACHDMQADLPRQFDARVWFDRSTAPTSIRQDGDADPAAKADPRGHRDVPSGL